ncbi:hypothetical protein FACS1894219_00460 [Clostridia bacterium]|nr:hypothetical protein FACS1894219_00460 [Clostridia bacterium]
MKKTTIFSVSTLILTAILVLSALYSVIASDIVSASVESVGNIYDTVEVSDLNALPVDGDGALSGSVSVSARSAVLLDGSSGNIIYAKDAYKRLAMASTTKIMTCLVALESGIPLENIVTITKEMTGAEGSSIYLYPGERFTLGDLLYALMLNSANDTAEAIAIYIAGSVEKFAVMMNLKADELRLTDTHFANPHGLDAPLHYTTALELAKITAAALKNESFEKIVSTETKVIYPKDAQGNDDPKGARYLHNHNKMLYRYDDAIGVKTGYTKSSGRSLVSAARRDKTLLIAVTINAPDDWNDHTSMLNYGFKNYSTVTLAYAGELKYELSIVGGIRYHKSADGKIEPIKIDSIKCESYGEVAASLPNYVMKEDVKLIVELRDFVYAPVKTGDIVGRVKFTHGGIIIAETEIVSSEDVYAPERQKNLWDKILQFFGITQE